MIARRGRRDTSRPTSRSSMRFGLACPNSNFDHRLSLKVREKAARPGRGVMVWPGRPGDKKSTRLSFGATTTNTRHYWANAGSSLLRPFRRYRGRAGTPLSRLSWFFAPFRESAGTTIVIIGKLLNAGCRRLRRLGGSSFRRAAVSAERIRESSTRSWVASTSQIPRCRSSQVFLFRSWILSAKPWR
jgi:hypothetical protein